MLFEYEDKKIQVYVFDLSELLLKVDHYHGLLSSDEKIKAVQLKKTNKHRQFILAHGLLHEVLGKCLNLPPEEIVFDKTEFGKPFIPGTPPPIHFNLSHSHERAAIIISEEHEVGIDIERILPRDKFQLIVDRFFNLEERKELEESSEHWETFYGIWTQKEAIAKLHGRSIWNQGEYPAPKAIISDIKIPGYVVRGAW